MRTPILATFLGLALLGACRSDNNTTVDGSTPTGDVKPPGDGTISGPLTIQMVQNDSLPPGSAVALKGVVVTAIDAYGAKTGDIWVEDPAGGAFSGVHVFGAPTATVATLKVGDIVDISGAQKSEFALSTDTSGNTETELEAGPNGMTVTKTGNGTVPAPMVVDALAIGQMATPAARAAEWEKWEGVLITIKNVSALQAPKCVGTSCTDSTLLSFNVTGGIAVESSITSVPMTIKFGDCLASVTGVESYFFNNLIYPTQSSDLATGGTMCPPAENGLTANVCSDSIDNDGNGFTDCNDLGCEVGANAWLGTTCTATDAMCGCSKNLVSGMSVATANSSFATTSGAGLLHDVYITGIAASSAGAGMGSEYWVSDSLQAAPNAGILVFSKPPAGATVGSKLTTLQGVVGPFGTAAQKQMEVSNATAATPTAGGVVLPITNATAAQLSDLANGGKYAGSLVQLTNVKVKTVGMHNQVVLVDNTNATITMDDDAFFNYSASATATVPAVGTCYSLLTGVMDLQTTDQVRTINPRSTADMVAGAACTGN